MCWVAGWTVNTNVLNNKSKYCLLQTNTTLLVAFYIFRIDSLPTWIKIEILIEQIGMICMINCIHLKQGSNPYSIFRKYRTRNGRHGQLTTILDAQYRSTSIGPLVASNKCFHQFRSNWDLRYMLLLFWMIKYIYTHSKVYVLSTFCQCFWWSRGHLP